MVALLVVPPRERVVEIALDLGTGLAERYRYGSGFRLGGRLVLTAAHVVAGAAAAGITVRDTDKVPHRARVVDGLAGDPDTVDLALLELCDQTPELQAPLVAAVDRDAPVPVPVEGCWAVGYPLFQEVKSAAGVMRETAQVWGMILPAEDLVSGLLSLQVTSAPRALPPQQEALGESQWSGMSGAAVLAGERLIGVVSEHVPRRGESTITVTPLANLDRLPAAAAAQWWVHLAADPGRLVTLPARRERAEPAYRATLRQLRARTGVLQDRDEELEAIAAFATGRPSALAPRESQHAWLTGRPWAGKTALLAEAVHALPPEVDCVAYFLRRPTGDADRERFLIAVVPQLCRLLDKDPPSTLDEYAFAQAWEQAAQRAADTGRQLLLVVDGLDEDLRPGGYSVAGWLPGRLPGRPARVLVDSRLYPRLPDDVDPAHPLAALARYNKLYKLSDSPHADRLRELADQEITRLQRRASDDLALDVLGLLTAARGGPLAVADLATLTGSRPLKVCGVLDGEAARTLQQVGPADTPRYTFAHETLLARCQEQGAAEPGHARRIEEWAATWRDRGWSAALDGEQGTPLYLLDRYPGTLYGDPPRLAALAGDAGWVTTAIRTLGVDAVLAELKTAAAAAPSEPRLAAMHAVVRGQAHNLRDREAAADPGFVPRQLCLQAAELGETLLAADCQTRQLASDDPGPVLQWTTRRASPALILELGRDESGVGAVAVLPDGRVVTGGGGGRVLVWDPAEPGTGPVELGRNGQGAVAVLPDGRVVTGGRGDGVGGGGRVLVWDPAEPGTGPVELGRDESGVGAVAVLPDGRVVTGGGGFGGGGRVLVWDPAESGTGPVELGRDESGVGAVAVLPDGRVVTGDYDGRVLVWDPAEPGTGPVELGRDEGEMKAVAVLPDGRVVTGGWLRRRSGAGVGPECGAARPGRARPRRGRDEGGGSAAGRAGGHRQRWLRRRRPGAGVGPGGPGHRSGRARPRRGQGGGGGGAAGRPGGHRQRRLRRRQPSAGVGPGGAGHRPGRARPPRARGGCGGGAAGRPGGHRRRRRGAGVGPGGAEHRSGRARPRRGQGGGGGRGGAAGWAGGHRRRRRLRRRPGTGVGPGGAGHRPGRARPPRGRGGDGGGAAGWAGGHRRRPRRRRRRR